MNYLLLFLSLSSKINKYSFKNKTTNQIDTPFNFCIAASVSSLKSKYSRQKMRDVSIFSNVGKNSETSVFYGSFRDVSKS